MEKPIAKKILGKHLPEIDGYSFKTKNKILEAMEEYLQQGIAHFISSKQDVIKSVCDHIYISSVAYKGAKICSRCGTYK